MTTKAVGRNLKAAFVKGAAWGTAVAAGAGSGILVLPYTAKRSRATLIDDSLGVPFAETADSAEIHVDSVTLPMYLRYEALDLLIALAMGATGGAPVQQGATTAYQQTFSLAENLDGLFGTFVGDLITYIEELTSIKLTGFTIKGQVGKPIEITFDGIAYDLIRDSLVNTSVTFANVTNSEYPRRVLYADGVIRMNNASDIALAAGDAITPTEFELAYKRPMKGIYGTSAGFNNIDEPASDALPTVTLKLTFGEDTDAQIFADWDANTYKKLDMTFTGTNISGVYNNSFAIQFPAMKINDADAPVVQGIISKTVTFDCLACPAAPTGMTATQPFQITVINRQAADVLA